MLATRQPDVLNDFQGAASAFVAGQAMVEQTELDVVDHRSVADEMKVLEHEPDPSSPHTGTLAVGESSDIDTIELIDPGCGGIEQAEQGQECGLA